MRALDNTEKAQALYPYHKLIDPNRALCVKTVCRNKAK